MGGVKGEREKTSWRERPTSSVVREARGSMTKTEELVEAVKGMYHKQHHGLVDDAYKAMGEPKGDLLPRDRRAFITDLRIMTNRRIWRGSDES